jgi:hypothetical protein
MCPKASRVGPLTTSQGMKIGCGRVSTRDQTQTPADAFTTAGREDRIWPARAGRDGVAHWWAECTAERPAW